MTSADIRPLLERYHAAGCPQSDAEVDAVIAGVQLRPERETFVLRREDLAWHAWALAFGALFLVATLAWAAWECWA